jgi:hypothetical protein
MNNQGGLTSVRSEDEVSNEIDTSSMEPYCSNEVSDPVLFLFILAGRPFPLVNRLNVSIQTTLQIVLDTTDGTYVLGFLSFSMTRIHVLKEMTQRRELFPIDGTLILVR